MSSTVEITAMAASTATSWPTWVLSLTMTFIPKTEPIAVIGRVTTAITVSRSAAMVILVSVRAR